MESSLPFPPPQPRLNNLIDTFSAISYDKFMHGKLKTALILLTEISGLLIIFLLVLLTLNFFRIISLPNPFSTSLISTTTQSHSKIININQSSQAPNPTSVQKQATEGQIAKYQVYASRFNKLQAQTSPNDFVADAIFSGYDSQTIQVITADGPLTLFFNQTTRFQKQQDPKISSSQNNGAPPEPAPYTTSADFFKNVVYGSIIQVIFTKPDLKAIQINYFGSIKPTR